MHEKDIELAKLLLDKLAALETRQEQLSADLAQAQDELETQWQMREERAKYLDILSRAADLLNRTDLREELPETTELEQQVTRLEDELMALTAEAAQHRELVDNLSEHAPGLIAIARSGNEPEPEAPSAVEDPAATDDATLAAQPAAGEDDEPEVLDAEAEPEATAEFEPGAPPADETAPEAVDPAQDDAAETDEAAAPADGEPAAPVATAEDEATPGATDAAPDAVPPAGVLDHGIDPEIPLGRFNLANLKRREAFTHGRGAAYIIDASSVLERVPNYDHYVRGIEVEAAREELIRDFDILGRELSGTFHLVFSAWFQYTTPHGNNLTVEFSTGPGEGTKEASDRRLRELVFEMTAKLRPVCVITGDRELLESVRGQGIHPILLGEFFRA